MNEKIRKAFDEWDGNNNPLSPKLATHQRQGAFEAGYRAALDALPSREEIGQLLCDEINGSCGCPPVGIDYASERIDALIRGKEEIKKSCKTCRHGNGACGCELQSGACDGSTRWEVQK